MDQTSFAALAVRLVLSLGVVLALMLGAAAVLKRKGGPRFGGKGATMEVVARQALTRTASLAVVRVGDRHLVLGVTEQSVSLIDEADGALFAPAAAMPAGAADEELEYEGAHRTVLPGGAPEGRSGPAWTALVETLREKTVRRS